GTTSGPISRPRTTRSCSSSCSSCAHTHRESSRLVSDAPVPGSLRPKQFFMGYAFDGTQRAQAHPYCPACGNVRTEGDSPSAEQCPSCGHRAFRNPYPGVCVLVVHNG